MTTTKQKILAAAEFDEELDSSHADNDEIKYLYAPRIMPLITALAEEVERLRGALEFVKLRARSMAYTEDGHSIVGTSNTMARKNFEIAVKDAQIIYQETKQALSPSPLDAFLSEGE